MRKNFKSILLFVILRVKLNDYRSIQKKLYIMKKTILLLFALFSTLMAFANSDSTVYSRESFTLAGNTIPYRKAEICNDGSALPALVIYLHGGSSRGDDNETQLGEVATDSIYNYLSSNGIPAIFLVPQCPTGLTWIGKPRQVVYELMRSYIIKDLADSTKVYMLGGSMGGTSTWTFASTYPNFFAGVMPVAGNPSGCSAENVATTPVYTVMGTADALMSISAVEEFQTQLLAAGGTMKFDIEEGWTHPNVCEWSYTTPRLDWLFSQQRGKKSYNVSDITELINVILGEAAVDLSKHDFDGNGIVDVSDVSTLISIILNQ